MTDGCPLFVELCAGTAALSLRLHAKHARPPVSRQGAKTGYADVILRVLGLRPGQGHADGTRYVWCEPDAGVRLLLEAYRDRELAKAAAEIIRSWKDEDPRALWERLRAEGPARHVCEAREVARWSITARWSVRAGDVSSGYSGPDVWAQPTAVGVASALSGAPTLPATIHPDAREVEPREVARWIFTHARTHRIGDGYAPERDPRPGRTGFQGQGPARGVLAGRLRGGLPATIHPDAREVEPREVARWVWTWGRSYNTKGPDAGFLPSESSNGTPVWNAHPPAHYADAVDRAPTLPATIHPDAREVDPREVARWALLGQWSYRRGDPESGFNAGLLRDREPTSTGGNGCKARTCEQEAGLWGGLQEHCASIHPDARAIDPPTLPPGTVAYMDPPYLNTTGYAQDLGRDEVVRLARRWADAGALVCISEAEPIPELLADGWHKVEITGERKGQRRTFSKQQAEWLTLNRAPAWVPSVQASLFGAA